MSFSDANEDAPFDVIDEVILQDLEEIKEQKQLLPIAQGVHVKIEKPSVRKSLSDNAKDAPKEGPNNPVAFKFLNLSFRLVDGLSVPLMDETGNPTGETELKYKNKVLFTGKMDLIFWHNPEIKTADWWKNKQYIFGFKALCKALGLDLKEVRVNDEFIQLLNDKELLLDITHEEEQELKEGKWVGKGTFKERIKNIRAWA